MRSGTAASGRGGAGASEARWAALEKRRKRKRETERRSVGKAIQRVKGGNNKRKQRKTTESKRGEWNRGGAHDADASVAGTARKRGIIDARRGVRARAGGSSARAARGARKERKGGTFRCCGCSRDSERFNGATVKVLLRARGLDV